MQLYLKSLTKQNNTSNWLAWILLLLIMIAGFIIRYPLVKYNIPVAAQIDERIGIEILHTLSTSLNPNYFEYPTLYYYINHFLFGSAQNLAQVLEYGRLLNLLFACILSVAVFYLARTFVQSTFVGLTAAALTMFSPILIQNGSYIITDIFMVSLLVGYYLSVNLFLKTYDHKPWFIAVILLGLAISTKYTAILALVPFMVAQFIWEPELTANIKPKHPITRLLTYQLPVHFISLAVLIGGSVLLAIYLWLPDSFLINILQTSANTNSIIDEGDLLFLANMRRMVLYGGLGLLFSGLIFLKFTSIARRFSSIRPYAGLLIAFVVFLMGTPFSIISWNLFLYDFGYQLKKNALSSDQTHWLTYFRWFTLNESWLILIFAIIGILFIIRRKPKISFLLTLHIVLVYASIGSASRGYVRYLTPLLPMLFSFAAFGIWALGNQINQRSKKAMVGYTFMGLCVLMIFVDAQPKISRKIYPYTQWVNSENKSYTLIINDLQPAKVYYSGFVPYMELKWQGLPVAEVTHTMLASGAFSLQDNEILLLDDEAKEFFNETAHIELIWSETASGVPQYIYRRAK